MAKKEKKKTYTALPAVPEEIEQRYQVVLRVISGELTVSDAARHLGLSRNHFQTLMHRGLSGLIQGLSPKQAGRPTKPSSERELQQDNARLRRENEKMTLQVDSAERMLLLASQLVRESRKTSRSRAKAKTGRKAKAGKPEDDDPQPETIERAGELVTMGLRRTLVAGLIGVSPATLRRWRSRHGSSEALVRRRGPRAGAPVEVGLAAEVDRRVRALHGLVGAESLRRSFPPLSRRQAATLKKRTVTAMESERKEGLCRVVITTAGVVRGFDAMDIETVEGRCYVLVSADASVPYRTSATPASRYRGDAVAAALEQDFARHGAPLVWRRDRAGAHATDEVNEVLRHYQVLALSGPPRYPLFYGQLERQNREHRAWLDPLGPIPDASLEDELEQMRAALNGLWRRPTLGWRTAEEAWRGRPAIEVDRCALADEVMERAARIERQMAVRGAPADLSQRLAIEAALARRGFLRREVGGWC